MMPAFEGISMRSILAGVPGLSERALVCAGRGIFIVHAAEPAYSIVFANAAFCRMTGHPLEQLVGMDCCFPYHAHNAPSKLAEMRNALADKKDVHAVLRGRREDGTIGWQDVSISPIVDETGAVAYFVGIQSDIAGRKQAEEQSCFQSAHETLTQLPNRQLLERHVQHAILHSDPQLQSVALLMVDIDHFKLINNSVDYDGADSLLQSFAERLRGCIAEHDSVLRYSADEFAVVLKGIGHSREVTAICERISHAVARPFPIKDQSLGVTCSIGIAQYPQDGHDAGMLLKNAATALHRAKELGRNNSQFFSRDMKERALARQKLESALRLAIERGQLFLHYQPLVDLQTGAVSGLEALCRWTHPELGPVPPSRFIAVAEECGLIAELGEWVLRTACHDMRRWKASDIPQVRVAINVSPRQFRDPLLAEKIGALLAETGVSPRMLCLEITENVLMQDTPVSEATLARLKTLGVDLVLDDFGTGFSSLNYLKRFSFDKVKIDCAFVQGIATDTDDGAISKAIISMAHSLGIRVVAEGVETEAQCDFLRLNMCDEIQGYLFSGALPSEQIEKFLCEAHRLPDHLLRLQKPPRTLLLVDDEVNIVSSLKRLLRPDNYNILTAHSGQEGLDVLARHEVDVIMSDQRMPGMTGVEFLSKAKEIYPNTVRIVLSGYTELQSVTDAVNQGAIYKFLTKPWDDIQLRGHVEEAFRRKEMADENLRLDLEVRTVNFELAQANRRLEEVLTQQQQQISRDEVSLDIVREALQHVPLPVIGLDEDDVVAFINGAAQLLFKDGGAMLGCDARAAMPGLFNVLDQADASGKCRVELGGALYEIICNNMGKGSLSRGRLMTLARQ